MKIIYVRPTLKTSSLKSKIMHFLRGRKLNVTQEGFFVQSLRPDATKSIKEMPNYELTNNDCVVVNSKATLTGTEINLFDQFKFIKRLHSTKVLFLAGDKSSSMPDDRVLDLFDLIFKREPYRDLDRYAIDIRNKAKVRTTMLPCPLVKPGQLNFLTFNSNVPKQFDVFFNGQATHKHRVQICSALKNDPSISFKGGLQSTTNLAVPSDIHFKKMNVKSYKKLIQQSKINLAIEGIGDFTYRHVDFFLKERL